MGEQKGTQGQHLGWDHTETGGDKTGLREGEKLLVPAPGSVFLSAVLGTVREEEIFL